MSSIKFRKNGGFYSVYGDDTYILYYLFNAGKKVTDIFTICYKNNNVIT